MDSVSDRRTNVTVSLDDAAFLALLALDYTIYIVHIS